jgi:hypothetical protein
MSTQLSNASAKKAVVWGNNIGVAYTGHAATANMPQTATFTQDGDEQEIRDATGEVQTFVYYNNRETLDIEVIPVGTSLANAKTANISPAKGDLVTITDPDSAHTELPSTYWICISSTQTNSNTAEVRISMSLRKYGTKNIGAL